MKKLPVAVMSDIHGNLAALDAVLADVERRRVDTLVNLGDIVSGPLDPAGTASRLMPLGLPTIRGNHERQRGEGGTWTAELIAVEYDWERVARAAAARGREDWSVALSSGRARRSESPQRRT